MYGFRIGTEDVFHRSNIANNSRYPVYYTQDYNPGFDGQQVAWININHGMRGEAYVSCENWVGKRIGNLYEISDWGIKVTEPDTPKKTARHKDDYER